MKATYKTLIKRVFSLVLTAVMMAQTAITVLPPTARAAEEIIPAVTAEVSSPYGNKLQLTDYLPKVIEYTDPISGFTHPGVGVTKEILENIQYQLRAGNEPWKSYFETMLLDAWFSGTEVGPTRKGGDFNNGHFISDASRAYAQAVMYFVTGNNAYRKNALTIIRQYEDIDPESLTYFTDACIHTGIPTNKMCIAAEIIRYSTYQITDGYTEGDLKWTDEDTEKFISNFLSPEVAVFQSSPDRFMNQHLYSNMGIMSAYLFMDDAEGYNKSVEWFTVNRNAHDQGYNGSIKRLFREITTLDSRGMAEGSGPRIAPVIQHVEMGRDQAHGCGDLTNAAILSRLMQSQNTKVDPVTGTVSTAANAVDCYAFLNDRLVKGADFFFRYMLGYDVDWEMAPYAIDEDGIVKDAYESFASPYRGRYSTINFWDFYTYYRYTRGMTPQQIKAAYPFFYDGYAQKTYTTWDNKDGGGDFWLFLPKEAQGDTSFIPNTSPAGILEIEHRGNVVSGRATGSVQTEGGVTYVHAVPSAEGTRIAMNSAGIESGTFQLRVRTKGTARLSMSGSGTDGVYLPDTNGQWANVTYKRTGGEALGDMYFFTLSELAADGYVDVDKLYTTPTNSVSFTGGQETYRLITYAGAPFRMTFGAEHATGYSGVNLPEGASVNANTGEVTWTPAAGEYIFYIRAAGTDSVALKRIEITACAGRAEAVARINSGFDRSTPYISDSRKAYDQALTAVNAALDSGSDADFSGLLTALNDAVNGLRPVSPLLKDDPLTDGTSLDFRDMNLGNRSTFGRDDTGAWLDNEPGSFVGFWLVEEQEGGFKGSIMDFGPDFRISVNKFGFQARSGFSDRLAGMQVFGSNDRQNWTQLTVAEAAYRQGYQTVDVAPQYHNEEYRYLMFKKTTEYPDVLHDSIGRLNEFGELRIWGTRYETGNLIESISMSCESESGGRIKMGDTVKVEVRGRAALNGLTVNINGIQAAITAGSENLYTATAVMQASDTCKTGAVNIEVNCLNAEGEAGEPFYGTTDGSGLFLINSNTFVDTGTLAKEITSSCDPYDKNRTRETNARMLFDGDVSTFGDLVEQFGGYYTVDFGEGVTVSLTDVMMMPRSTGQNHANRLNNTVIYGSNDGNTWTQLTPAVTGATNGVWHHVPESAIMSKDAYRYFKIDGAENGDIAEVEFYGSYGADVSMVAGQIKSLPVHEATETTLIYPSVPAGFTVAVKSSSNEGVISTSGTVSAAMEDMTVNLVLTVASGDKTADTSSIPVTVRGLKTLLTGLSSPAKSATALILPAVPDGYTVTVVEDGSTGIVAANGTISNRPARDTLVTLKMQLTRSSDSASVESGPYIILIYGTTESGKVDVNEAASMSGSSGSWDGTQDAATVAKQLFDGNTGTFGDLKSGNTYTIDFGDGVTVQPSKFRLHPRVSHVDRMNNTVIKGSNDGENWTDITAPLTGAVAGWSEITAEQFVNCGAFRCFQITGAGSGNIAEVEFYGIKEGTATEQPDPPEPPQPTEPPEGAVEVKSTAVSMTASSGDWNDTMTAEQCAQQLFDGNLDTFGDLKNGNIYTIDFGESKTITPADFWVYPRKGTGNKPPQEYVERLNGVKFQGSNDGENWVDLTDALSGITKTEGSVKWYKMTMQQNESTAYRYIRITGGQGGNIAEVRIYGEVANTAPAVGDDPVVPDGPGPDELVQPDSTPAAPGAPDTDSSQIPDGNETPDQGMDVNPDEIPAPFPDGEPIKDPDEGSDENLSEGSGGDSGGTV